MPIRGPNCVPIDRLELDPAYVDTIVRRWQALTGGSARHSASGRSFDDLACEAEAANAD